MAVVNKHIEVLIFTAYVWKLYNVVLPAAVVLTLLHRDGVPACSGLTRMVHLTLRFPGAYAAAYRPFTQLGDEERFPS
jgi:hypothetical protein